MGFFNCGAKLFDFINSGSTIGMNGGGGGGEILLKIPLCPKEAAHERRQKGA